MRRIDMLDPNELEERLARRAFVVKRLKISAIVFLVIVALIVIVQKVG